jgi:hypothetical protein
MIAREAQSLTFLYCASENSDQLTRGQQRIQLPSFSSACCATASSPGGGRKLDEAGMPVAWSHRFAGSSILARWLPPAFNNGLDPDTTNGAIDLPYALPNMRVEYLRIEPPPGIPTAGVVTLGTNTVSQAASRL